MEPQVAPEDERDSAEGDLPEPFANARDFNPVPPEMDIAGTTSEQIFAEIGDQLRKRREMLSLTYEEIERHTRVRAAFLKALEDGALDSLSSPVQTRGILANYAAFIDLDVDAILLRFADALQARHREQKPQWPPRKHSPMAVHTDLPPLRVFIASDLIFGGGVAIMLILFSIWGINRVVAVRSASPARATSPSISDILAGTALPTVPEQVTVIPAQDTPLAATAPATEAPVFFTLDPNAKVQIALAADEGTFMRITVDGNVLFEGRAEAGKSYTYRALKRVEVLTGNGAGIRITYNGLDQGLMGSFGEVVDRIYTVDGAFTPTATSAPTRTPTSIPTGTASLTPTLPTYTPTPKPGD
jgi:cytoskeleton protein RodZ